MKNVYLAQISFGYADAPYSYYPYSVASIWAYALTNPTIANNYNLGKFLYLLDTDIEAVVASLNNPSVVGFSIYVWNTVYSLTLAKAIKQKYPDCIIVFGGPNVPTNTHNWLLEHSFIDYTILQEGESAFTSLLTNIHDFSNEPVPGVSYINNGVYTYTPPIRILSLEDIPSPYVTGLLDDVTSDAKARGLTLNAVIETDRGCPYQCTFCDWGSLVYQKVRKLSLDRVFQEITWMANNNIELVQQANANFGMFIERDGAIIDHLITENKRTGWPKVFDGSWAKNLKPAHLELVEKLIDQGLFRRFSASVQSFNPKTLEVIKRKNTIDFQLLLDLCHKKNIPISTELILGLPGESADSFKQGIAYCIKNNIVSYTSLLTVLENSELNNPEYIKTHDIQSVSMYPDTNTDVKNSYVDPTNLLVGHSLLTRSEYVDLVIWSHLVTHIYSYRAYNHIINKLANSTTNLVTVLDTVVTKLRTNSVIKPIIDRYSNHVEDGITNDLSANGINSVDLEIMQKFNTLTDKENLDWWQDIDPSITIKDIVHQRLSINRNFDTFDKIYNSKRYTSPGIPKRHSNWMVWLITTRWNNNAERQVKEIT
jgi:radical SAM superfamily enzyme YgiQ (UPF0313 family)